MQSPANEIKKQSRKLAKELLAQAKKNEPFITADLQKIAAELSIEMAGLENTFKTVQSLTRKLSKELKVSAKILTGLGYSFDQAIEKSGRRQAARNNDALRYTYIFPFENYVFGFKRTIERLRQKNYEIPENRIWNAWKNIGTDFDKGYRGINITVISSEKQKFEIQFHTRESYELKTETYPLYEILRSGKISSKLKVEIPEKIIRLAQKVKIPKGVKKL